LSEEFASQDARDRVFLEVEAALVRDGRRALEEVRSVHRRPGLCRLETGLVNALVAEGFVQVATPTIMSRAHLAKMGVDDDHDLVRQIFWLDRDRCLRPMLAPHLYFVVKDLLRLWEKPVRIFELGSCFRKESQGARHSIEFTMLNLCEFGLPEETREGRIRELVGLVATAAAVGDYRLEEEQSAVYGDTIDVMSPAGLELGSAAMGPHALDHAWRITDPWVGVGFGLERLLMAARGEDSIGGLGRSLSSFDGIPLRL
jgi:phenylalanyl-tRNA synthetase alpha chain